jgi:mycothiol synthase
MKIRSAEMSDSKELTRLFEVYDLHISGEIETTEEDTQDILKAVPNLASYTWVSETDGKVTGFAVMTNSGGDTYPSLVIAHPEFHHQGIESSLIDRMNGAIITGTITVSSNNEYEHALFGESGFKPVRHWFNMKIDLREGSQVDPEIPSGFTIEPFTLNKDEEETHRAFEESFQTHFDYTPSSLEEFLKRTERQGFDPGLWLLLKKEEQIAGFVFCKRSTERHAEITHLGVRPQWRKKGLGEILLNNAFHTLVNDGRPVIDLNVDSENGTGAVKLYQRVGMEINRHFIRYDKRIGE